ncbi:MAG TPA: DUF47 family protein [Methanoregulaceae archaeon]|nr:MAG: DUF47 domain-containing protein [Methanolinea sp.]HON81347.1 DUF47 family protein [Methanoregulaceae archaeon]HPD09789.1 DUF47 family protein [Methanoregulaceae archaeon]HRT14490.1 DUF47 family protein [Methanoregulaceae archaeon]HRU30061.1 DUF47 family protein [Methanoregulaceae archaeon]
MGLKEWLIPQDKIFFDLFDRLMATVVLASYRLVDLVDDFTDVKTKVDNLERLEHEGDKITHEIYENLNRTFITPLDPEEISKLASALDDILDYIEGTAQTMYTYGITETDAYMVELAKIIQLSVVELEDAVKGIRTMKNPHQVEHRCIEVNRLENLADDILAHAISNIFKTQDPIAIIKGKDIYQHLEIATDKCEDAANVLSDIAIRHS